MRTAHGTLLIQEVLLPGGAVDCPDQRAFGRHASPDRLDARPVTEVVPLGYTGEGGEVDAAEIVVDMDQFPTADHLAWWAGMAPGNHKSAGKRTRGKTRKGSRWLRASLVVATQAAGRSKNNALGASYRSLTARHSPKRAAVAVGHFLLLASYYILTDHLPYDEHLHVPKLARPASPTHLVHQLHALGYDVIVHPVHPAA